MAETPDVTPASDWTVPNQDKIEQVIDARFGKTNDSEPATSEPTESQPTDTDHEPAPTNDEVQDQADKPKS